MKGPTEENIIRKNRHKLSQRQRQLLTGLFAGIIVAASLFIAGVVFDRWITKTALPANQQCLNAKEAMKDAAKTFSVQLVAALDSKDAPAPDLSAVKSASSECKNSADTVTVKVEAQK